MANSPETLIPGTLVEDMLERILNTSRDLKSQVETGELKDKAQKAWTEGEDKLADTLGISDDAQAREKFRKQARVGAGIGALALLLSSRARGKTVKLAGLAGLGALAYKAYQKNGNKVPTSKDEVIGLISGDKARKRSQALLTAAVAAAQADGHLSEAEHTLILAQAGDGEAVLRDILATNPNARSVAALADSPQSAREIYAVSARIADGLNAPERLYLDTLAMALELDPDTAAKIETDVRV